MGGEADDTDAPAEDAVAVAVAGEALIDLVPDGATTVALPGGSPVNVAVGLARLGVATGFVGALGDDAYAELLREHLRRDGVSLTGVVASERPTTLATVEVTDGGEASYRFTLAGTASDDVAIAATRPLPDGAVLHVSFGALTPADPAAGRALATLVEREHGERLVTLDPNVRPPAITDPAAHAAALERLVAVADVVRASDADLAALPGDPEATARRWAMAGPALVLVTRGEDGATALTADGRRLDVPAPRVAVIDTVGAGDAFTSGFLAALVARGVTTREALERLDGDGLAAAVEHAVRVAALTCQRRGADPPRADEVASAAASDPPQRAVGQ